MATTVDLARQSETTSHGIVFPQSVAEPHIERPSMDQGNEIVGTFPTSDPNKTTHDESDD